MYTHIVYSLVAIFIGGFDFPFFICCFTKNWKYQYIAVLFMRCQMTPGIVYIFTKFILAISYKKMLLFKKRSVSIYAHT